MKRFVGFDLGGTAIKHGAVSETGSVEASGSTPTPHGGRDAILDCLADIASAYVESHAVDGVGIGTAGAVDFESGRVLGHSPNIPGWGDTPVKQSLQDRLNLPVAVDNDANCMALAEMHAGAGRGFRDLFFLTLGTGIGSAVVLDGRLKRGAHSLGGEWGHATIVQDGRLCACGQRGHLEAYASATALVHRTVELAREGIASGFSGSADPATLGSLDVFSAAARGDAAATRAINETATYLATGVASVINLLDPELVVVGGGMAQAGATFLAQVETQVRALVHKAVAPYVRLVPAELGNRAGFIGAALLLAGDAGRLRP